MELLYIEQKTTDKYRPLVEKLFLAMLMSLGFIAVTFSMFSISLKLHLDVGVGDGFYYLWNEVANTLGKSHYILLDTFKSDASSCGYFMVLMFIILIIINYFVLEMKTIAGFWLYFLPPICLTFAFQLSPSYSGALVYGITSLTAFFYILNKGKNYYISLLTMVLALILTAGVINIQNLDSNYKRPFIINETADKLIEAVEEIRYGINPLKSGKLAVLTNRDNDEDIAIKLTMEKPKPIYLRGFVGSRYSSNEWKPLSNETYYNNRDLFYWLKEDDFSPFMQLSNVEEIVENKVLEKNDIDIKVVNASTKWRYLPYEIMDIEGGKSYEDSVVMSRGFNGEKEYTIKASDSLTDRWTELAARVFSIKEDKILKKYRRLESHYNVFVYENYLTIPNNVLEILSKEIGYRGNQKKAHIGYKLAIEKVRDYFRDNVIYTDIISEKEATKDFLEEFFEKKKGYDVHYATAAIMMFRYYGIPARYVEGYIVTPEMVKNKKSGETIEIRKKENHGFCEIYIDSLGWVPIEVVPEYIELMPQPDMSIGIESKSVINPFKDKEVAQYADVTDTENDNKDVGVRIPWKILLLIVLAIIVTTTFCKISVPLIVKYKANRRFKRLFNSTDNREAVCAMYEYLKTTGEFSGYEITKEAINIAYKAGYSTKEVSDKDRKFWFNEMMRYKNEKKNK